MTREYAGNRAPREIFRSIEQARSFLGHMLDSLPMTRTVWMTGGTGYIGRPLIEELTKRGTEVVALVREQSVSRLPPNCQPVIGDPLDHATFAAKIPRDCTFVQLVGVPHPSPAKAKQFREIDLLSVRESAAAASAARVAHFVYLSVPQPAPVMKDYIAVRAEGEAMIRASGIPATILRPWYVLVAVRTNSCDT